MKSVPEGSMFHVPWVNVDREPQAPGLLLVARRAPRTAIVAVYLFKPAPTGKLGVAGRALPARADAIGAALMSSIQMHSGALPPLGIHPDFRREDWPFPEVARPADSGGQWVIKQLDDRNVMKEVAYRLAPAGEAAHLPSDSIRAGSWPSIALREIDDRLRRDF